MLQKISTHLKKKNKGFTLVELIVVIAILAILAAIAVPQLLGFQERARQTADQQTAAQVKNAVGLLWANKEIVVSGASSFRIDDTGSVTIVTDLITSPSATKDTAIENMVTTGTTALVRNFSLRNEDREVFVGLDESGQVRAIVVNAGDTPFTAPDTLATWIPKEEE